MAVLETIRVKFGIVITVLIAVALLSFIIDPTTLQSVSSSMSDKYDVGNIDGKAVSYNDFQAEVDKFTTINEITTGSSTTGIISSSSTLLFTVSSKIFASVAGITTGSSSAAIM